MFFLHFAGYFVHSKNLNSGQTAKKVKKFVLRIAKYNVLNLNP